MKISLAFLYFLLVALFLPTATTTAVGDGTLTPVIRCGSKITVSAVLTQNLICGSGDGLVIAGNNVSLDCNGHSILSNGTGTLFGIVLANRVSDTVKNCLVGASGNSPFVVGIRIGNSSDLLIVNNTVENAQEGIVLSSKSNDNLFANNTIGKSRAYGFVLLEGSDNTLVDNHVISNSIIGFDIGDGSNNTLMGNVAMKSDRGFSFDGTGASHDQIKENIATENNYGFVVSDGSKISFSNDAASFGLTGFIDSTHGSGNSGTANTYSTNQCENITVPSKPAGLCLS